MLLSNGLELVFHFCSGSYRFGALAETLKLKMVSKITRNRSHNN